MNFASDVVPIKSYPKIASAVPVGVEFVILAKDCKKMFHVLFVDVLHSKVIDDESEADGAPIVAPVAWCNGALAISSDK